VIATLRSLGLTIKEIEQPAGAYLGRPDEPIGPRLAALPERARPRRRRRLHVAADRRSDPHRASPRSRPRAGAGRGAPQG
jgi:hypothetical protein